jgi:hypothetical protein
MSATSTTTPVTTAPVVTVGDHLKEVEGQYKNRLEYHDGMMQQFKEELEVLLTCDCIEQCVLHAHLIETSANEVDMCTIWLHRIALLRKYEPRLMLNVWELSWTYCEAINTFLMHGISVDLRKCLNKEDLYFDPFEPRDKRDDAYDFLKRLFSQPSTPQQLQRLPPLLKATKTQAPATATITAERPFVKTMFRKREREQVEPAPIKEPAVEPATAA